MSPVIRIPEPLYTRLQEHARGFDTPANVIERILNFYDEHAATKNATKRIPKESSAVRSNSLEIVYHPDGEDAFKKAFLEKKRALIYIYNSDGTFEKKVWNASRFSPNSSVSANLRSGYLRDWRRKGIYRAEVTIETKIFSRRGTYNVLQDQEHSMLESDTKSCIGDRVGTRDHNIQVLLDLGYRQVRNTTVFQRDDNFILSPAVSEGENGKYWFDVRDVNLRRINERAVLLVRIVPDLFIVHPVHAISSLFSTHLKDNRRHSGEVWGIHIDLDKSSGKAFLFNAKDRDNKISSNLLDIDQVYDAVAGLA